MKAFLIPFLSVVLPLCGTALATEPPPAVLVDSKLSQEDPRKNAYSGPASAVVREAMKGNDIPAQISLVLDSSGSMGAILDKNRSKMFYMKQITKTFLQSQWKQKNVIGVRVYGGRKKNSCSDIELPIGYSDRSLPRLEKIMQTMSPVGMTPLHKSIEASIEDLRKRPKPRKLVIVTDGEDTCAGNPCESADLVRREKLDIEMYVVALGFDGETDSLKKLECLGDMQVARDGQSFDEAMSQISAKIQNRDNLKVISPNPKAPVYLYKFDGDKSRLVRVFYASSPQSVEPGDYEAVVALNPAYRFERFRIPPRERVTLKVEGTGTVHVKFFNSLLKAELLDKNNKVVLRFKSDQPTQAPIGQWRLRVFHNPFFEVLIQDYLVVPNGKHEYEVQGASAVRVRSAELSGLYVYSQENTLIDHAITGSTMVLKSGIYTFHRDEGCSFPKVPLRPKKEVIVLDCGSVQPR